jgi:PTH1 family peptidyl-tRNA hydrolase
VRFFRRGEGASTLDLLVVGLGNPGREYERTRHNAGWLVLDELARRHGGSWRSKFSGSLAEVRLDGLRLALLKPETYMNDSGRSVGCSGAVLQGRARRAAGRARRRRPRAGRLQARLGGGLAGHNGLRSLAQHLGSQEFLRPADRRGTAGPR